MDRDEQLLRYVILQDGTVVDVQAMREAIQALDQSMRALRQSFVEAFIDAVRNILASIPFWLLNAYVRGGLVHPSSRAGRVRRAHRPRRGG